MWMTPGRIVRAVAALVLVAAIYAPLASCSPEGGSAGGDQTTSDAASSTPSSKDAAASQTTPPAKEAGSTSGSSSGSAGGGSDGGCAAGTTLCSGACANVSADPSNCGACGKVCPTGEVCQSGACGCRTGQTTCSGACVDTTSDPKNCGACGTACATGMVCLTSKCGSSCGTLTLCGSACVDTTGNSLDCGGCGKACPSDQFCYAGACQCAAGEGACGTNGACVDITTSAQHCGSCTPCATGATCVPQANAASTCACPAGEIVCSGACVDPDTNASNCGKCGTVCGTGTQCLDGACLNPTSVNCGGGAMVGETCIANPGSTAGGPGSVTEGQYWVNNNQWGIPNSGTSGQQCVWGTCQTGDLVGWGTSWNWTTGTGGVKTYGSIVFGWQYGFVVPNTGLPIPISSGQAVNCGWDFSVAGSGTIDVSYDTWLHTSDVSKAANDGANSTPTEEIMVWLYESGGAGPISATGSTPAASNLTISGIPGMTWNLYQGQSGSTWRVSSYVRQTPAPTVNTTAVMNMMDFYNDLVTRGWIPNTRYLSSIQAGTEVFTGSGSLTTNGFYCRVQ